MSPAYTFTPLIPAQHLESVVKNFFVLEYDMDGLHTDYLLPDGLPSIFYIQASSPVTFHFGKRTIHLQNGFYTGYSNTIVKVTHGRFKIVGASAFPVYFRAISGKSLREAINLFMPLEGMEQPIELFRSGKVNEIVERLAQHITYRLNALDTGHHFLGLYRSLVKPGGYNQRVEDLAVQLGYSTRTLHAHFNECFGMSPKKFMKLLRFNYALKYLYDNLDNWDYSSIALEAGYHDQSHLIRDFKAISGRTPKEISANPTSLASKFRLF